MTTTTRNPAPWMELKHHLPAHALDEISQGIGLPPSEAVLRMLTEVCTHATSPEDFAELIDYLNNQGNIKNAPCARHDAHGLERAQHAVRRLLLRFSQLSLVAACQTYQSPVEGGGRLTSEGLQNLHALLDFASGYTGKRATRPAELGGGHADVVQHQIDRFDAAVADLAALPDAPPEFQQAIDELVGAASDFIAVMEGD
ncbi:MAG TPA: hypothetical protein VFY35_00775 [Burkholderiaceae bacterium]|nr:hypothetical protein [Burkholderiaceae bacterium]